jgi:glutamate-1-semialdehyde 2,1-aminomutase
MRTYHNSEKLLERALRTIPLGSQTFSKSKTQYPLGVSPFFIQQGIGSRVWDVDGNEYVDFINSLAAVTLGYQDPDVDSAVAAQLREGVTFSLPHPIEMEVAEKIVELVPCAEMVRFGKNGSDATAGAVRLARAYTGRDHVAVCGYHGWQDWYIGSTSRNSGVPKSVRDLTHAFTYGDLAGLDALLRKYSDQFAAVILEPMNVHFPPNGYLAGVKELAHKHGALLIFDETITGFRFEIGGAQQYFDIIPDLATFGKGLANGYPLSAIAGRADVMALMEEIFFSFTFGGETLSLAAALATMRKLEVEPVIQRLATQGEKIKNGVNDVINRNDAVEFFSISGHPSWTFFSIQDAPQVSAYKLKTLYLQEMFKRDILALSAHNMSYAHSDSDIEKLLDAYGEVIPLLIEARDSNAFRHMIKCEPLKPLFKIR